MSQGERSTRDDDAGTSSPPATYLPGSAVAGHRLVRMIGAGGVGVVYEAVHEFTQRRVALKLLLPHYASSEQVRERAHKEAIALCRLRHKNIVAVHSADTLPDGTVWIAMELLEGQSLRRICQVESPLPIARALHIGIEIADGLAAAHDLGIVHRDVKPENVFVDRHGEVKLLDLNIAKIRVDGLPSTRPGQRFGTTAYTAPEECWGEPCSPASDVYALSLVIYELLAGRYVFATGRGLSGMPSEAQLVAAHMLRMPVPVHELVPAIPDYVWPVWTTGQT
jgi:eukaryotic-like serine/threonine-protein kinase